MTGLPPRIRARMYAVYAALGVFVGALQVGFSAAEVKQPVWLTVTLAVYAFIGGAIGYTAASNTPTGTPDATP